MLDKIKQLTKDTAVYGISTMVGRFLTFLLVPLYTNKFIPVEYGIQSQVYVFISILNIILLFGMDTAYMKYAVNVKNLDEEKNNFSTPYLTVIIVSFLICLVVLLLQRPVFNLLAIPSNYNYLIYYTSLILFIDSLTIIPFVKLRIERKAKKFALFKIIGIFLNITLNFFLIVKLGWGVKAIFISNLASSALTLLLLFPSILKSFRFTIDIAVLKKLLKFGLPFLPAGLSSIMIQGIDRPILAKLTDLNTAGIYSANYKLGIFMMLFVSMFQYAWQPFFFQNAQEKNIKQVFSKILTYFTIAGSLILVFLSLFIDNIVKFHFHGGTLIGHNYWSGLVIVPIILFGYLFNGMYYILSAGMFIEEKSSYIPIITGVGAAINVGVNFLLIPVWGIIGAALATLASYLVMAIAVYMITQKFYKIDYEKFKVIKTLGFVIIAGSVYYYLRYCGNLLFSYKLFILMGFIAALLLFVFDKNEMGFIKKKIGLAS
ncbi:MAG: oligosaccharide flippase family protein [Ignavibacteriaceae bacterium]|nr:oligosaccharide flippase family protein [Ignavibacteriaceae bacterium]